MLTICQDLTCLISRQSSLIYETSSDFFQPPQQENAKHFRSPSRSEGQGFERSDAVPREARGKVFRAKRRESLAKRGTRFFERSDAGVYRMVYPIFVSYKGMIRSAVASTRRRPIPKLAILNVQSPLF